VISIRRVLDEWLGRPILDWPVSAFGAIAAVLLPYTHDFLSHVALSSRDTLYNSLSNSLAALLGFFVTSVTILLALLDSPRPRLRRALSGNRTTLLAPVFFGAIYASAISLVLILALPIVGAYLPKAPLDEAIFTVAVVLITLRTTRLLWLLRKFLAAAAIEDDSKAMDSSG
jgi:cation transport ATPase